MNLNILKTYVRVVETQNLSRTADEFGLSQPAITKQIQALEDKYGVLLLERSGRRLKTTEAGDTLYNFAKEIIKYMDKTDKAMEEVSESRRGSLCIGASTIPGQYIIPPLLKNFKDKFPNVSISLDIGDTEKIFTKIIERELDIGFVGGWINNRKVEGFKWLEDKLVVIVPENHKLAINEEVEVTDLATEKWIFREKGSGTQRAVEELLLAHGIKKDELNIYIEAGSTEAALAMVESGVGISIMSDWAIKKIDTRRKIKALKINSSNAQRSIYIIFPRQKARRKSVNSFLEFIRNFEDFKTR